MNTVEAQVVALVEALGFVVGAVIGAALTLLALLWGGRWLMSEFKSHASAGFDRDEHERQGRETDMNNNLRGMSPGWGGFSGQRGSGLQRGRR